MFTGPRPSGAISKLRFSIPPPSRSSKAKSCEGQTGYVIQRSDSGGKTWNTPGSNPQELTSSDGMLEDESNKFVYDTSAETGKPLTGR